MCLMGPRRYYRDACTDFWWLGAGCVCLSKRHGPGQDSKGWIFFLKRKHISLCVRTSIVFVKAFDKLFFLFEAVLYNTLCVMRTKWND